MGAKVYPKHTFGQQLSIPLVTKTKTVTKTETKTKWPEPYVRWTFCNMPRSLTYSCDSDVTILQSFTYLLNICLQAC